MQNDRFGLKANIQPPAIQIKELRIGTAKCYFFRDGTGRNSQIDRHRNLYKLHHFMNNQNVSVSNWNKNCIACCMIDRFFASFQQYGQKSHAKN